MLCVRSTSDLILEQMGYLLGLKQQQASVHQAWQAILQQREASKQSRALIVFTVITIVFVRPSQRVSRKAIPLTYLASPLIHVQRLRHEQLRIYRRQHGPVITTRPDV